MTLSTNQNRIVRARAPLRLGLAGGGTDLSPYSDNFGGAVLNATINRYAFASIEEGQGDNFRFIASDLGITEEFKTTDPLLGRSRLVLHAGVVRRIFADYMRGEYSPFTLHTMVDAPMGSGLGSSSALVVAMVDAFREYFKLPLGPYDVAHLAFEIERRDLALAGGKQDQYAAAFGGLNFIEFLAEDRVIVNPLRVSRDHFAELEMSLVICFSGISRRSEEIIKQQQRRMGSARKNDLSHLHQLKKDALEMKQALLAGSITDMSEILNRSWAAKKQTASGVSTRRIDQLLELAKERGATGAKVSGAGGGGFLMFIVPPDKRFDVLDGLTNAGATAVGAGLTMTGCEAWTRNG